MRPRTQTLLIGFLIILLVCGHLIKPVTNYLMLPIGRILAFGGSVYVGLTVNPVIGLLIALVCLQAMSEFYIIEHMTDAEKQAADEKRKQEEALLKAQASARTEENRLFVPVPDCECPPGYTFQEGTNDCKNAEGKIVKPSMCRCSPGYAYDTVAGTCIQNSVMSSPIPATAAAPEDAIPVTPEPEPRGPAASSIRPMQIELSAEDKLAVLGKAPAAAPPAPAEESS